MNLFNKACLAFTALAGVTAISPEAKAERCGFKALAPDVVVSTVPETQRMRMKNIMEILTCSEQHQDVVLLSDRALDFLAEADILLDMQPRTNTPEVKLVIKDGRGVLSFHPMLINFGNAYAAKQVLENAVRAHDAGCVLDGTYSMGATLDAHLKVQTGLSSTIVDRHSAVQPCARGI